MRSLLFFRRRLFGLWLVGLALFIALAVFPVSYRSLRAVSLALIVALWVGAIILSWHQRAVRFLLVGATLLCVGLLALPARGLPSAEALRRDYVTGLLRYEGVRYIWGGENFTGIDCSGLIRRGLIDSLFLRGLRTFDGALVRRAISLWWHDSTAEALGRGYGGMTAGLQETPSLNQLDHTSLLPGDLAVTKSGLHILAYLGEKRWIEADPVIMRVIAVPIPAADNPWFSTPMKIVRWRILEPSSGTY